MPEAAKDERPKPFCQSDPIEVASDSLLAKTTRKKTIEIGKRCDPRVFRGIALLNAAPATKAASDFYQQWPEVKIALAWLRDGMKEPPPPAPAAPPATDDEDNDDEDG